MSEGECYVVSRAVVEGVAAVGSINGQLTSSLSFDEGVEGKSWLGAPSLREEASGRERRRAA